MTATPAQVANDLDAQAKYWRGRDRDIEEVCRDGAWLIRQMIAGAPVRGTRTGLYKRLINMTGSAMQDRQPQIFTSLTRARLTIDELERGARE